MDTLLLSVHFGILKHLDVLLEMTEQISSTVSGALFQLVFSNQMQNVLFIVFASDKWQLIIKLIKVIETLVYDSLETNK